MPIWPPFHCFWFTNIAAVTSYENALFQEDKCFCRFLTDVARISLSLSSLCCKENHRCCNLSRKNLDRKSELWSDSGVHGKKRFPFEKDTFVTFPHTSVDNNNFAAAWRECIRCAKFFKPSPSRPHLMEEIGFEAQKDSLLYVFVTVFSVDRAQTTIGFEFCMTS